MTDETPLSRVRAFQRAANPNRDYQWPAEEAANIGGVPLYFDDLEALVDTDEDDAVEEALRRWREAEAEAADTQRRFDALVTSDKAKQGAADWMLNRLLNDKLIDKGTYTSLCGLLRDQIDATKFLTHSEDWGPLTDRYRAAEVRAKDAETERDRLAARVAGLEAIVAEGNQRDRALALLLLRNGGQVEFTKVERETAPWHGQLISYPNLVTGGLMLAYSADGVTVGIAPEAEREVVIGAGSPETSALTHCPTYGAPEWHVDGRRGWNPIDVECEDCAGTYGSEDED